MNGAESLVRVLLGGGVDVWFANPGTSEMHLVQAIDGVDGARAVLCLFEGVATGAADGFGRMAGRPAATLLHLGAGLGNGVANLHNARRAGTPLINVVGDHAVHHVAFDAPLTADIEGIARPVSAWVRTARSSEGLGLDGVAAVDAAMAPNPNPLGNISTLIVPADCAWGPGRESGSVLATVRPRVSADAIGSVASALGPSSVLLLDGEGLTEAGVNAAGRIAAATGAALMSTTFPARVEQGPGLPAVARMPYFPEQIVATLERVEHIVLAGSEAPVSFFAYPDLPSDLVPVGCTVSRLAHRHEDVVQALRDLADALDAPADGVAVESARPALPDGPLNTRNVALVLGALAPDGSIFSADSGGGGAAYPVVQGAARHSWLNLTGGSIGQGGPAATGAAIACPDRPVFALLGDGGAMYTNQCLWTQAREGLNVTTVIFKNSSYGILDVEYRRLGVNEVGEKAASMFDLARPEIDWVGLAASQGVPGVRAQTCEELATAVGSALSEDGPYLIEALV